MNRGTTMMLAAALVLAACGGGDDDTADAPADAPADAVAESLTDEAADLTQTVEGGDDATTEEEAPAAEEANGDAPAGDDAIDDEFIVPEERDMTMVASVGDLPPECRDEMGAFLQQVEPIVGSTDWAAATPADFDAIADQFGAIADEFDELSAASGCDVIAVDGVSDYDLLIQFAADVAPNTVGFFEFVRGFAPAEGQGPNVTAPPNG